MNSINFIAAYMKGVKPKILSFTGGPESTEL